MKIIFEDPLGCIGWYNYTYVFVILQVVQTELFFSHQNITNCQ